MKTTTIQPQLNRSILSSTEDDGFGPPPEELDMEEVPEDQLLPLGEAESRRDYIQEHFWSSMTLRAYFHEWCAVMRRFKSSSTVARYEELFRIYLEPQLGHIPIESLTREECRAAIWAIPQTKVKRAVWMKKAKKKMLLETDKLVSTTTTMMVTRMFEQSMGDAAHNDIIWNGNPIEGITDEFAEQHRTTPPPEREKPDPYDIRLLFIASSEVSWYFRELISVLALTKLTISELCALRWEDVRIVADPFPGPLFPRPNKYQGVVTVRGRVRGGRVVELDEGRQRVVILGNEACERLLYWKKRWNKHRGVLGWGATDFVFPNRKGHALDPANLVHRQLKRANAITGVPPIRFSDLRGSLKPPGKFEFRRAVESVAADNQELDRALLKSMGIEG